MTLRLFLSTCVILSSVYRTQQHDASADVEDTKLLDSLLKDYDTRMRPTAPNGTEDKPLIVNVNMFLLDVSSISDYDMDLEVQVTLKQSWVDPRLSYDRRGKPDYVSLRDVTKLWTPDLFFINKKDGHLHDLLAANVFLRIHPSGRVDYSARLSLTLWCHMKLKNFPFDTQKCSIKMASYGYTTQHLLFRWQPDHDIRVADDLLVAGFRLGETRTSTVNATVYSEDDGILSAENYSCLKVELVFRRAVSYHLFHSFLPSVVLVAASWTSLWLGRRLLERLMVTLCMLILLASTAADIESSMPHVAYVKAMDVWMAGCFAFILAVLGELVLVAASEDTAPGEDAATIDLKPLVPTSPDSPQPPPKTPPKSGLCPQLLSRLPRDPRHLDSLTRRVLPPLFFVFTVLYFITYAVFAGD